MTLANFLAANLITATAEPATSNPNMFGMPYGSKHWLVTFERIHRGQTFVLDVPFSQGPALESPPTAADVLDNLASDAFGFEQASGLNDWAREYGFGPLNDAARIYQNVKRQTRKLEVFLGSGLFQTLLYDVERL